MPSKSSEEGLVDKNIIKKFAKWARRELITRVSQRAVQYEVTESGFGEENLSHIGDRVLTKTEQNQRSALVKAILSKRGEYRSAYEQVIEEVAYIWFNRFCALRYMEVNNYLPSHLRVLSNKEGACKPQILDEAMNLELDGIDKEKIFTLKNEHKEEELFRYLLTLECNSLREILPEIFQIIDDFTVLLLPDFLLREGSVIQEMVTSIPEEDWTDQVQIIGWLYQYYNAEKKAEVFVNLKEKIKISKENIPSATQLFTPDWIVRYMIENSLGRLWLEGHPSAELRTSWEYYLDEAEQTSDVQSQLDIIKKEYAKLNPEDIRCIDPCMGSGHILVYMFDVLMQIYRYYGYSDHDSVRLILEKNLFGLDIDCRAAQLAYFSVMMKARSYDREFFRRKITHHVHAIRESNGYSAELFDYFAKGDEGLKLAIESIVADLENAKEYGSILQVQNVDFARIYKRFWEIVDDTNILKDTCLEILLPLVQVAETLAQKYHVVVTNPPYMGAGNMNPKLSAFIKKNYANYKMDFFSAFMVRCSEMTIPNGKLGFFTPYVWMFIQSYEKLRKFLCESKTIETLIQFEYSAFEGATVPVCTLAFSNYHVDKKACYLYLGDFKGDMEVQRKKTLEGIANHDCGFYYESQSSNFSRIPKSRVAFTLSKTSISAFKADLIGNMIQTRVGLDTGNNAKYLRFWHEVLVGKIHFQAYGADDVSGCYKYVPHTKGGHFRRWYGNFEYILAFDTINYSKLLQSGNHLPSRQFYFKEGITWTRATSAGFSVRYTPAGMVFNSACPTAFADKKVLLYSLGLLNSKIAVLYVKGLNPTVNTQVGDINLVPYVFDKKTSEFIVELVQQNITLSRTDWDSFETSWDFQRHPLIRNCATVEEAFALWRAECEERFARLKATEEELNRLSFGIYGLENDLSPEVADKDVTVKKADLQREIRSLISYAVGCMLGRYSLDQDGLVFAGGTLDHSKYTIFPVEDDGIIPICNDHYFAEDIVARFAEFLGVVYGKDTIEENLTFIAETLGGEGTARDKIRDYFRKEFYADHCKIYKKSPIYWLFDSGKEMGFQALVYLHRYAKNTIARLRTGYVHEQQARYKTTLKWLNQELASADKKGKERLEPDIKEVQKKANEIHEYEEKIHHLADQMIAIDLDDGVKANYAKFQEVLAKIK